MRRTGPRECTPPLRTGSFPPIHHARAVRLEPAECARSDCRSLPRPTRRPYHGAAVLLCFGAAMYRGAAVLPRPARRPYCPVLQCCLVLPCCFVLRCYPVQPAARDAHCLCCPVPLCCRAAPTNPPVPPRPTRPSCRAPRTAVLPHRTRPSRSTARPTNPPVLPRPAVLPCPIPSHCAAPSRPTRRPPHQPARAARPVRPTNPPRAARATT